MSEKDHRTEADYQAAADWAEHDMTLDPTSTTALRGDAAAAFGRETLARATSDDMPADERWFWTEGWQAGEREVDEHIRAGRVTRHDTPEDFIADLEDVSERREPPE